VKIDKVIFSSSERFSVFWNVISKVWKTKVGIEPVCLLFGEKKNTDMTEEYGQVIEVPIMPEYPLLIQITWSKFFWPTLEPHTTWLLGDMDMCPLATDWWTTNIADMPDDYYLHLDADGITQLNGTPFTWANKEINRRNQQDRGHDTNLPAQYHCGKGHILKKGLSINAGWADEIANIVNSGEFNGTRGFRPEDPIEQNNLWCAEELRSTRAIRKNCHLGRLNFKGYFLKTGLRPPDCDIVHKDFYDGEKDGFIHYDMERLRTGGYKSMHLLRPFKEYYSQAECDKFWAANLKILRIAGMWD
jgi:hypothetical protein